MDKLKKMLHKDKPNEGGAGASAGGSSTAGSGEHVEGAERVVLHTTMGDITVQLFAKETPKVRQLLGWLGACALTGADLQELCDPSKDWQVRQCRLPSHHPRCVPPFLARQFLLHANLSQTS